MSSKKLYVAGKWADRERLHGIIQDLRAAGYEITHDWTQVEVEEGEQRTVEHQNKCADLDISGVRSADLVIVDMQDKDYAYRGSWTEIGCALGIRIPVWIIGPASSNCFYYASGCEHFLTWDSVMVSLKERYYVLSQEEKEVVKKATESLQKKSQHNFGKKEEGKKYELSEHEKKLVERARECIQSAERIQRQKDKTLNMSKV